METVGDAGADELALTKHCKTRAFLLQALRQALECAFTLTNEEQLMAKALSKSQLEAEIAGKHGITKKQAGEILTSIVELAYKNAKNTFTLPGLGKLVLVNRKARMGRNPATGETIKIAAKRVVKFRVAKAAKDAILGKK
jgi:DNA-binding protein HU-beta